MDCDKTHGARGRKCSGIQKQHTNPTPKSESSKRVVGHLKWSPYLERIASDERMRKWIVERIVERALVNLKEGDDHEEI